MDGGTLHNPLETGGWLRIAGAIGRQASQILVEEFGQIGAKLIEIDAASP
jgi:hypothetical protein